MNFNYTVYYMKSDFFRDGTMGYDWLVERNQVPTFATLAKTHVNLLSIQARDPEQVFYHMQAHVWSPNGEACDLIESKGLHHTSMSVGDCLVERDGHWEQLYICDRVGFQKIGEPRRVEHDDPDWADHVPFNSDRERFGG